MPFNDKRFDCRKKIYTQAKLNKYTRKQINRKRDERDGKREREQVMVNKIENYLLTLSPAGEMCLSGY